MNSNSQSVYNLKKMTSIGDLKARSELNAIFKFFLPNLQEGSAVLEIGPGLGKFAFECRSRNLVYYGIEPSTELFNRLDKYGFKLVNQKVPPIPIESEKFDLVHSRDFVEHLLNYAEVIDFLLESFRVLKPGGFISVLAPNYMTIRNLFFQYEYQHMYITTIERLINMLKDCEFEIIKYCCFLLWLSPKLNWMDRIIAHTILPLSINNLSQGLLNVFLPKRITFKIYKNMFDHLAILAKKPT